MKIFTRNLLSLFFAAVITYIIGTIIGTILEFRSIPAKIPLANYIETIAFNIKGQPLYLVVISIGFSIAFPIAAKLRKSFKNIAAIGYPLAGATAIGIALGLMYLQFETVPISGGRSAFGFIMQLIAGSLGGFTFSKLHKPLN
ncbi:MAG: hypothetical protein ABJG88_09350 [Litorimonas sp.]